ncbi:FABP family protein [Glycomyces albus]
MSGHEVPEEYASTFAQVEPYPFEETEDLRTGPNLHDDLVPLLPWSAAGAAGARGYPGTEDFLYAQEVAFTHDGRPFLHYTARSWIIDTEGKPVRPAAQETGWWRPVKGKDPKKPEVEVLLAHPTGILDLYYGHVDGNRIELATDAVVRSPEAKEVTASKRLYGLVEGALMYAVEMAAEGKP